MKRLICILLICLLLLSLSSCDLLLALPGFDSTEGETDKDKGDGDGEDKGETPEEAPKPVEKVSTGGITYEYNKAKKYYVVTSALMAQSTLTVAETVGGFPVSEIADGAFKDHTMLKKLVVGDNILKMGKFMLEGCKNLEELTIPYIGPAAGQINGNKEMSIGYLFTDERPSGADGWSSGSVGTGGDGNWVNYYVPTSLKKITVNGGSLWEESFTACHECEEIILGDSITSLGSGVFQFMRGLKKVRLPANIRGIGYECFWDCSSLTHIELGDSVELINRRGFVNCSNLVSIVLPASLKTIANQAFDSCEDLSKVFYKGTLEQWENIEIDSFNEGIEQATIYIYSENEPEVDGSYWHYDADGVPVIWGE